MATQVALGGRQSQLLQGVADSLGVLVAADAVDPQWLAGQGSHTHARMQRFVRILKHQLDAPSQLAQLTLRQGGRGPAEQVHRPGGGRRQACCQPRQRRLAGAAAADDRNRLAGIDAQRHPPQSGNVGVAAATASVLHPDVVEAHRRRRLGARAAARRQRAGVAPFGRVTGRFRRGSGDRGNGSVMTGHRDRSDGPALRRDGLAVVLAVRAARGERTADRRLRRIADCTPNRPQVSCGPMQRRERLHQQRCVGMQRAGDHLTSGPGLHHPPAVQHGQVVGAGSGERQVVRDQPHVEVELVTQFVEQVEDPTLIDHVEAGGGLIGNQQLGPVRNGHRDHHPLALASAQLMGERPMAFRREADAVQELPRLVARRAGAAVQRSRLGNLVQDRHGGVEHAHGGLGHQRDVAAADLLKALPSEPTQIDGIEHYRLSTHVPGMRHQPRHREPQRRLPRTRLADQAQHPAPAHLHAGLAHRGDAVVVDRHRPHVEAHIGGARLGSGLRELTPSRRPPAVPAQLGIGELLECISHEGKADDEDGERNAGRHDPPEPRVGEDGTAVVGEVQRGAPADAARIAEAQERHPRLHDHCHRSRADELRHQQRHQAPQDVDHHDPH